MPTTVKQKENACGILSGMTDYLTDILCLCYAARKTSNITDDQFSISFSLLKSLKKKIDIADLKFLLPTHEFSDLEWDTQIEKLTDEQISNKYNSSVNSIKEFRRIYKALSSYGKL